MTTAGRRDYHVHYFADPCAHPEMTVENTVQEALRLGLEEICILKHYCATLPNGQDHWVSWKRIVPEAFERFLQEIRSQPPSPGLRLLAGVESELLNDSGEINIPAAQAARLDAVILSVHWLPRLASATADPALCPGRLHESPPDAVAAWQATVRTQGAEALLRDLVTAYVRAMERNPKVRVLGHMFDGLLPLRSYGVPVDDLPDARLLLLMEPLMAACVRHGVLWELTPGEIRRPAVLTRANELGVRFCATADAHFLQTPGWANLSEHDRAEAVLDHHHLTRGVLRPAPTSRDPGN